MKNHYRIRYLDLSLIVLFFLLSLNSYSQDPVLCDTETCQYSGYGDNLRLLWIPGLPGPSNIRYNTTETSLSFDKFADGTCHIYGDMYNQAESDYGFYIDVWFRDRRTWDEWMPLGRWWKGDEVDVQDNYEDWDYYVMDESKTNQLVGLGAYEGSLLSLSHKPSNHYYGLQVGLAANDQDADYGFSCWMFYEGQVLGENVDGACDINGKYECTNEVVMECIGDVDLVCGEEFSLESTGIPEVTCPGYTLSYSDEIEGDCPVEVTRTWLASNENGESMTCVQRITIPDSEGPAFTFTPDNIVVSNISQIDTDLVQAIDNCSDPVVSSAVDAIQSTGDGECGQFRTQTPGGWGSPANGNNPGSYRNANFEAAFPDGLVVGCANTITLTTASAVEDFLPSGGTPSILTQSFVDPTEVGNTLIGHLVALSLSLGFDQYDSGFSEASQLLKDQILIGGTFNGWRVGDLVELANDVLGGCNPSYTASEITEALATINENFVDGTMDNGNVLCIDVLGECEELFLVTYTATDECGNTSVIYQLVTVQAGEEFSFTDCPEDLEVECSNVPEAPEISYYTECTEEQIAPLEETIIDGDCAGSYTIIRTWSAINSLGEVFSCSQTISVVDETAPIFMNAPVDITVSCGEVPEASIEVEEGCALQQTDIQIQEEQLSGSCYPVIQRIFIAEDDCGNVSSHTQYITVVDTEAPEISNTPDNLTLNCGEEIPEYSPEATDNCATEFIVEFVESEIEFDCGYQLEQVWLVTDNCFNTTSVSRVINFEDTSAPYLEEELVPITIECGEEIPTPDFIDDCGGEVFVGTSEPVLSSCNESFEILFAVTDNCGNSAEFSQLVTRIDSNAPIIEILSSEVEVSCGAQGDVDVPEVIDCSEAELTYVDTFDSNGGCPILHRTWTATDACGNVSTENQDIILVDDQAPQFLNELMDITTTCVDLSTPVTPPVTDNCDDDVEVTFEELSTPISCGVELVRTWIATDNCGNTSIMSQTVTVTDEVSPVITGETEITVDCGASPESLVTVMDDCADYVDLTYEDTENSADSCQREVSRTYTATDVCGNTSTFNQTIMFIDETAPVISEVPILRYQCDSEIEEPVFPEAIDDCSEVLMSYEDTEEIIGCRRVITRTWTAEDECGNSSTRIQSIIISDTTPPVFEGTPEDLSLTCGAFIPEPLDFSVTDNCSAVEVSYNEETMPGACADTYTITRTWTATDQCDNSSELIQVIEVADSDPPVFDQVLLDITASCGEELPVPEVTASDACGGTVKIQYDQQVSPGGCPNIFRVWTASDMCGNSSTLVQTIFIEDNEPPLMEGVQFNLEATCENVPDLPVPFVSDNCDDNVDVTVSESVNGSGCEQMLIRTWIATDDCGNTTIATQSISLIDEAPPVFINPIEDNAVECDDLNMLPMPEVQDNCGGDVDITFTDEVLSEGCEGEILRTYVAADLCGNTASLEQTIHIIDLSPPTISGVLAGTFVDCSSIPPALTPVVFDNCNNDDIEVVFTEEIQGNTSDCSYVIVRRWVATDVCGNSSEAVRYIFVQDISAPELSEMPDNMLLNCDGVLPSAETITAFDNCMGVVEVEFTETTVTTSCGSVTERTWSSSDGCGNGVEHTQTIEITDLEEPILGDIPEDVSTDCFNVPVASEVTATDNCDVSPTVIMSEEIVTGECPYSILRTWTAEDKCGNTSSRTQTILVTDEEAPVFDFLPENTTVSCSDLDAPFNMTAADNCAEPEITFSEEILGEGCERILVRTWEARDYCGNTTTHTQEIMLLDTENPIVGDFDPEVYFECREEVIFPEVEFTDDCTELQVNYTEEVIEGTCTSVYDVVRNWTATDACGNATSVSQTIHVTDTLSPQLSEESEEITVDCDEVPAIPTVAVLGECGDFETEFNQEIEFLEELGNTCQLGNAESLNGDISIWLPDLSSAGSDFVFGSEPGTFTSDHASGEVTITGQVYNVNNQNQSWILNLILYDQQKWNVWSSNGGSYKDDLDLAGDNYLNWDYYKLSSESTLIGAGEFEGSELNLRHTPVDYTYGFQVGLGANNRNSEYGISGWFFYEGTLNGDYTFGSGDLIAEIKCCPDQDIIRTWTAVDCAGNSSVVTQIIHVRKDLNLTDLGVSEISEARFDVLSTVGNEFIMTFESGDDTEKTLIMTDASGRIVESVTYSGLEKNTRYTRRISKDGIINGMYFFNLKGDTEEGSDKELNIN